MSTPTHDNTELGVEVVCIVGLYINARAHTNTYTLFTAFITNVNKYNTRNNVTLFTINKFYFFTIVKECATFSHRWCPNKNQYSLTVHTASLLPVQRSTTTD